MHDGLRSSGLEVGTVHCGVLLQTCTGTRSLVTQCPCFSFVQEMEDALAAARDNNSAVELAKEQAQTREAEVRNRLQARVSELEEEIVARDANSQSEQSALRDAFAKQAQELRQSLGEITHCRTARATAEATAQAREDARCAAVEIATTIQAQLEGAQGDVKLAQEETQTVTGHLVEARAALETSQTEAKRRHEAQDIARRSESARVRADMAWEESRQQGAQLTEDVRALKAQLSEARASATQLEAVIEEQRGALKMSGLKVNQLEGESTMHAHGYRLVVGVYDAPRSGLPSPCLQ